MPFDLSILYRDPIVLKWRYKMKKIRNMRSLLTWISYGWRS